MMTMVKQRLTAAAAALLLVSLAGSASAQTQLSLGREVPLARVVLELYRAEIEENLALVPDASQEFIEGQVQDIEDALLISQALSSQLSTFPMGSSAGGFSWTFDPALGTFSRSSASFGPTFAERALTVGRGRLNVGANYQRATYDEFEGVNLRNGEVKFFTAFGSLVPGGPELVGEDSLTLKVSTDTLGFFANYGLTDRLDLGVALPIVRVNLDASLRFVFLDPQGQRVNAFEQVRTAGRSKTGFGDIVLRGKYNVLPQEGGGIGVGVDLRLPTGDEDNLIGIPGTQAKIYGIYSSALGRIAPHVNIGYTFSTGNSAVSDPTSVFLTPPDEFNYAAGFDVSVNPRLTVAADLVGRTLRNVSRLEVVDVGLGPQFQEFSSTAPGVLQLPMAAFGAKYQLRDNLLVSGNLLLPLTSNGLRDNLTPALGFDYSF